MNFLEEPCVGIFYTVLHSEKMVDLMERFCQEERSRDEQRTHTHI